MNNALVTRVIEKLNQLPEDLQQRVWDFVETLSESTRRGVSGKRLLRFAGLITPDDLKLMRQAIEAGCEQVDTRDAHFQDVEGLKVEAW